ncbi:MAG: hypothetical protein NUK65_12715 [Firmicutes bacterium]|nr:hypothetical protein [Bacillota bacterium]
MSVKSELEKQICDALKDAKFPIISIEHMMESFPMGVLHVCTYEDAEIKISDAKDKLKEEDFPVNDAQALASMMTSYYPYV